MQARIDQTRARHWSTLTLAFAIISTLLAVPLHTPAQSDTVTITAPEFQRMIYSADLLTRVAEKPELEASLQVLLELQRHNPNAAPAGLAALSRQALQQFRTNAPAYVRASGLRDEILAAYLEALRQLPARTNFIPANLTLLNRLVTRAAAPTAEPQADLIHSGSQSLLGSEGDLVQRQKLLDTCIARAETHPAFRAAMDNLLWPETFVSLTNDPVEIIGNTNSALHDNLTMQTLLALSGVSGDGSLTISSNQLMALFTNETHTFWETINTNLAVQREINQNQTDLLAYLTNQPALAANAQQLSVLTQGQSGRIASATAAILVQSQLMAARDPLIKLPGQMQGCAEGLHKITDGFAAFSGSDATKLAKVAAAGNVLSGAMDVFGLFFGGESPEEEIAREVGNIKTLLGDLSTNMNYRFDRVDQSLVQIYDTLTEQFGQITNYFDAQGREIAHLNGDVDQIRLSLLDAQTDLDRIERNLVTFHALDWRFNFLEDMNLALAYEGRVGNPMAYDLYTPSYVSMENVFFTHAYNRATGEILSHYTTLPFGDEYYYSQLTPGGTTNVYAETLNYIKKILRQRLLLPGFPETPLLANPQDWNSGANAWMQLALENPNHFRRYERDAGYPSRLEGIISKGNDLANFFRSLTFSGTNVNWTLYAALETFYLGKLTNFTTQIRASEQQYATSHGFALDTWRQWSGSVPRFTTTSTEVLLAPTAAIPASATNVVAIEAGSYHNLALKADGTVIGWGSLPPYYDYGQCNPPASATNVVAIAAGGRHSLALRADGTVVGWGDNTYGQANGAAAGGPAVAIAAGGSHNLVLRSNGTVFGWGANGSGQTNIPANATQIVAISAGSDHSLALRGDGTILAWGDNSWGQCNIPATATNIVAIAAGQAHNLALRADGIVVGWGKNNYGEGNGAGAGSNVVAIAAGWNQSLAIKADGTAVAWGTWFSGETTVPARATNVIMITAGTYHSLYLTATGTVGAAIESPSFYTRAQIPPRIGTLLHDLTGLLLTNLDSDFHAAANELCGAKAVLQAVVNLGMPDTLERDDILRGFLYGSESLMDLATARSFLINEQEKLAARSDAKPQVLTEVAALRYLRCVERLEARLNNIATTGQPELPRLISQTLKLLSLLRDAWSTAAPPALESGRTNNIPNMVIYGEPYAHYTLQFRDNLDATGWISAGVTNLHSEQSITLPTAGPKGFYRVMLPTP